MSIFPKVSIVIPVYNGERFVEDAIKSALNQLYKNTEIIIVNDGSEDGTEVICQGYAKKHSNIKYIKKENGGVSSALNVGISKAEGEYISWLSHDDMYEPNKISKQIDFLDKRTNKDVILYSNYIVVDEKGAEIRRTKFEASFPPNKLLVPLFPILRGLVHGCSLLIPKKCFNEIGCFDENLRYTQDYDLWYRMFPNYEIAFQPDCLIRSRWHEGQDSKKQSNFLECDNLWINMVSGLQTHQLLSIEESPFIFYKKMQELMNGARYFEAEKFAQNKLLQYQGVCSEEPLVSVVIPFYNRVLMTVQALESVLNQTYKNIEIILVNDCSTDDLAPIHKVIDSSDGKIKLLNNQTNSGAAKSRNNGLSVAKGEFICFLDSDDLWIETKLETQVKMMIENGWSISHSSYMTRDINTGEEKNHLVGKKNYDLAKLIESCQIATPTVMLKRDILQSTDLFRTDFRSGEDVSAWIDLAERFVIHGIEKPMTIVRVTTTTTARNPKALTIGIGNIIQHVLQKKYAAFYIKEITKLLNAYVNCVVSLDNSVAQPVIPPLRKRGGIRGWYKRKTKKLKSFFRRGK